MRTTKLIAETEQLLEKIEALADEAAPIDCALARRLRELARRRRVALKCVEAGEYCIPDEDDWIMRSDGGAH
ncbi:MAG: hypothetical protein ACLQMF_07245 [Rectinemataceae bacterium]